jgi:cytokinin dehydrogenase
LTNEDVGPLSGGLSTSYAHNVGAYASGSASEGNVVFPFNLIRIPPSNDAASAEQMVAKNRMLYELICAAGGFQYPVGALPMYDWKHHFGSKWSLLTDAKRR